MTLSPDLAPNLKLALAGQYEIERELGRGGMGLVYLARDLALDRLVAIKVIHPDLSTNPAVVSRFLAEARVVAKLRHPNIVAVHAAGQIDGQVYFVMDYLGGETLRDRLRRDGSLSVAVATRIAGAVAEALDAAAAADVVHRDLKPENILLIGPEALPTALLADFGIAQLAHGNDASTTGPATVMGTPAYMSPEQAVGEPLDSRSDLYALGVVSYEMLTGRAPFVGPHRTVISKQIIDPPPPLCTLRPDIPEHVGQAVMRALEKVPEARWPTGASFRRALASPGEPTEEPALPTRARPRRSWTTSWLAAALLFAAGVAGSFLALRRTGEHTAANPRHSILILPFGNLRDDRSLEWLKEGSVSMLALSLSQWNDLTVVDQDRVHDLVARSGTASLGLDQALAMARSSRVGTLVLGEFDRVGDSLRLVARRYDVASGNRLDVIQVEGAGLADVRPLYDQLAAQLLDLTGAPASDRASLTSVTTGSVEAYRAYLNGVAALNHWRLNDAITALETAVRLDPDFSLANYKLAVARGWSSPSDTLGMVAIRAASRTSGQLPPRERQMIEGYRSFVEGDFEAAMALYGQLIVRDSTDVEAWYGSADAAFHGGYASRQAGLLTRSLRGFRRVIELDSTFALAYEHAGALLTDAANRNGWLRLVGDSLAWDGVPNPLNREPARQQATALARAWTQIQPNTLRAHYHLYQAYLSGGRVQEAQQSVRSIRALVPPRQQALLGFLDARAQLVGGDLEGSAETVRRVLPQVDTSHFRTLDLATEPISDLLTGVDVLGYFGDLDGAAAVIKLGTTLYSTLVERQDSVERARRNEMWELSRLGLLYAAAGTRPDRLKSVWNRFSTLVKTGTERDRKLAAESMGGTAVGMLLGPTGDASGVAEIDRLTSQQSPASIRALLAARSGDRAAASRLLASASRIKTAPIDSSTWKYPFDQRPIIAEAYFELGRFEEAVSTLERFGPEDFQTKGLDTRWIWLPRVRLLRGQALEQLGRARDAAVEYRAVLDQWAGADAELEPFLHQAQLGLARVAGVAAVS